VVFFSNFVSLFFFLSAKTRQRTGLRPLSVAMSHNGQLPPPLSLNEVTGALPPPPLVVGGEVEQGSAALLGAPATKNSKRKVRLTRRIAMPIGSHNGKYHQLILFVVQI
jgi:hypothetical protein